MKKVKFFALALMLVLGLVGGAYAAWTDAVTIEGTVETGDIDLEFQSASVKEQYADNAGVATFSVTIPGGDPKSLKIDIGNAYPDYWAEAQFNIKNEGTVPVKVSKITVDFDDARSDLVLTADKASIGTGLDIANQIQVTGDFLALEVGQQFNGGAHQTYLLKNTILGQAIQDHDEYGYTITIDFIQWNLYGDS